MHAVKKFCKKYKHGLFFLYMLVYFPWFGYLERTVTTDFHEIHMAIDDVIPFCEVFIVPYLLWFAYVIGVVATLFFVDDREFTRYCICLGIGMTVFLIVSTIYPNGHYLRPTTFERDNIFTAIVAFVYGTDTATNLFPSVHVYNAVASFFAVKNSKHVKRKGTVVFCFILTAAIVLSTVFTKQHSIFDVITAFALAFVVWIPLYSPIALHPLQKKEEAVQTQVI